MRLKTIRDAATALNVSESRVRRAAQARQVPTMQLGNRTLVDIDAAREVLDEPDGVKIQAASEQTGLTITAIRRAIREGWMPYTKRGKAFVFDMEAVQAAIAQRIQGQRRSK
jgi:hypothetical protein